MTYVDFIHLARSAGLTVTERGTKARITGRGIHASGVTITLGKPVAEGLVKMIERIAAKGERG